MTEIGGSICNPNLVQHVPVFTVHCTVCTGMDFSQLPLNNTPDRLEVWHSFFQSRGDEP